MVAISCICIVNITKRMTATTNHLRTQRRVQVKDEGIYSKGSELTGKARRLRYSHPVQVAHPTHGEASLARPSRYIDQE